MYRTATAACTNSSGQTMSAGYGYTEDNLTSVSSETTRYTFTYGDFSLRSSVKIGSRTLASYSYSSGSNRLSQLTYGNGDYVQYTYDAQGRVIKETFEDGHSVSYAYDRRGNFARTLDSASGVKTTYYYDSLGRPSGYRAYAPGNDIIVQYAYDSNGNVAYKTEITNGVSKYYTYTYDDDNRIASMTADGITVEYTYDSLGRLTKQVTKNGSTVISTKNTTYATSSSGKATAQVRTHNGYTYTYDGNGNILSVSDGTYTTSYVYDSQNQLIRENNQALGKSWTWTYDAGGNITCRTEYAYTTGTLGPATVIRNNLYEDSEWRDLITSYCDCPITRDDIGNVTGYYGWTYTWKHGRQLATASKNGVTWTYSYDANGLRTSRSNGTTTYRYYYSGDKLTVMTKGSTRLSFTYDAAGNPLTLTYNGTKYYYNTNLQGDVVGILDSSGTQVVTYIYDAWGRPYSTTGSLASTLGADNPLRYRGYVYDSETWFYYLQSRYYNPKWGRFINAHIPTPTIAKLCDNLFACHIAKQYRSYDWAPLGISNDSRSNNQTGLHTIFYEVPVYDQDAYRLCWAFCQIMIEDYKNGISRSNIEATQCAIELAKTVYGEKNWNRGGWPTNTSNRFSECGKNNPSIESIYFALAKYGPIYAYYGGNSGAHLVVITGVDLNNNLIYTNNPWGRTGKQSYQQFLQGFAGMPTAWHMPFGFLIFPDL